MKLATLKLYGGPEIRKLLKNLKKDPEDEPLSPFREAVSRLKRYLKNLNPMQEITVFQGIKQLEDENVKKILGETARTGGKV